MSRCASKRLTKKDSSQEISEGRASKDNFNRLRSVFEIRRPNKSPNSTLRKSKSTSVLSVPQNSDDEEIKSGKDKVFVRNSSSRASIRSTTKPRKGSYRQTLKEHDKTKSSLDNIDTTSTTVEEFSKKPKKEQEIITTDDNYSNSNFSLNKQHLSKFAKLQEKLNKLYAVNKYNKEDSEDEASRIFEENIEEGIFTKNYDQPTKAPHYHKYYSDDFCANSSGSNKYYKSVNTQRQSKKDRENTKSFLDAECEGETETYRKSLVLEMDLQVAKMKLDGFIDEEENIDTTTSDIDEDMEELHCSKVSRYKKLFEGMFHEFDKNVEILQTEYESRKSKDSCQHSQVMKLGDEELLSDCEECVENLNIMEEDEANTLNNEETFNKDIHDPVHDNISTQYETNLEEEFCESLGEDLETGSFFVEAYNDDGRELVIVELSIERRAINLDKPFSLESIQNSFKNADMVFQENKDKSLNVINDPKELVHGDAELVSYGPHSNRSTMYSTTSRDSDIFDTDDEGISMGNTEQRNLEDGAYNNVRRETFCDHKGVVRIERIGYPETVHDPLFEDGGEPQSPVSRNNSFTQKGRLSYIIDEIKLTEKKYVDDLEKVVNKYMPYIECHTPPNLIGKNCYIFGNIHALLEHQREFLDALENCGEEVEDIMSTFINFEHLFELYPNYFKNKPKADVVLREFSPVVKKAQEKFKERLDLSAYLLTPLQRLGKYKLFLENIEKQLHKLELPTGSATMALEIIKREMSKGNDFVAIESIESSPINKLEYGSFKMREKFNIIKPRRFESMVFLFENMIVFTLNNQSNVENYIYCDSIEMNDLRIATFEDLTIHLTDFTKCKKMPRSDKFTYVLEARTEKIKDTWRQTIEAILWQQLLKVKESTMRMYQTKSAKRGKVSRSRVKSIGSSTFYVAI